VVVKNTLARRALTESQRQQGGLEGICPVQPHWCWQARSVSAAKVLSDFAKEFENPR
jgi:ribosomal protein L10